jgi:hypothetical protein
MTHREIRVFLLLVSFEIDKRRIWTPAPLLAPNSHAGMSNCRLVGRRHLNIGALDPIERQGRLHCLLLCFLQLDPFMMSSAAGKRQQLGIGPKGR